MHVTPQGGPRQVLRSPPLKHTTACNAIRSYEKRKASNKKKRKDLAVLAKSPRLHRGHIDMFFSGALFVISGFCLLFG